MLQLKILSISSIIGILGVAITCIEAVPIEVIYKGDSCDCPKKIDYLVKIPLPSKSNEDIPSEYGYKVECPVHARGKITYRYDLTAEKPEIPLPPPPEKKLELYAKIDRIMAPIQDCIEVPEVRKTYGCHQSASCSRYVSPRYTRNLRHPNSIDSMASSTDSHITAIFFTPLTKIKLGPSKLRNKRDLSSLFMRPRKNEKRPDRLVKRYNKSLKDISSEKTSLDDTLMPLSMRRITARTSNAMRPLQQLSSFLNLPRLRNKRDIKGEYDLIEKERAQMDLTLPEIIQYMPETLDPNFKRNQCNFSKSCRLVEDTEKEKTTTAANTPSTSTTTSTTTKSPITVTTTESKQSKESKDDETDKNNIKIKKKKKLINKTKTATHKKRNANGYNDACQLAVGSYNPTPKFKLAYEPLAYFEPLGKPFSPASSLYGLKPVPQQYLGVSHNLHSPRTFDDPLLGDPYTKPSVQQTSNAELDRIIAEIVSRHRDFIEASSHRDGALVDPPKVQKEEAKDFLKGIFAVPFNGWFGDNHHQQQQLQQPAIYSHALPMTYLPSYFNN